MFIKRLEIYGFKSFPYKVNIHFSPGITAIIGPNGSGKSNILDAIRWILGEQSPKKLRVKELSDLIFSGDLPKKIDFAEVKLVINHDPPVWEKFKDFSEIVITRRFYRNGEGEFFINQKPCRLKDIQFLFLDLGINPQSYGIIEQGEIAKFLEYSPKEKKLFLEDLAGISKLKITEEETRKNIKKTQENLVRLQDIINEIEIQYKHLKKQAEEAKKYLKLKDKLQKLLIQKNCYLLKKFLNEKSQIEQKFNELLNNKNELEKEIENLEIEEQKCLQEFIKIEREIKDLEEEIYSKEKLYKDWEKKFLNLLKEEKELRYKLEKEKLKEKTEKEKLITLTKELEIIKKSLEDLKKKAETLKIDLNDLKKKKEVHLKSYKELLNQFKEYETIYLNLIKEKEKFLEKKNFLNREINKLLKDKELAEKNFEIISEEKNRIQKEKNIWHNLLKEKEDLIKSLENEIERKVLIEKKIQKKLNHFLTKKQKYISEIKSLEDRLALINKILAKDNFKSLTNTFKLPYLGELLDNLEKEDLNLLESVLKDKLNALVINDLNLLKEIKINDNLIFYFKKNNINDFFKIKKAETLSEEIIEEYQANPQYIYIFKDKIFFTPSGFIYFIKSTKEGKFSLKKEKEELIKLKSELEEQLKKVLNIEKKLNIHLQNFKSKIDNLKIEFKKNQKEYNTLIKQKENFKISRVKLEEQYKILKEKLENFNKNFSRLKNEKEEAIKNLNMIENQLKNYTEKYTKLQKEKYHLEKTLKNFDKSLNAIYQEIMKIKAQKETLQNRKKEIQMNIEKIQNFLKNFVFSIELIQNDINYIVSKIKEVKNKKNLILQELDILKDKLKNINEEQKSLDNLVKQKELERKNKEKELKYINTQRYNLEVKLAEIKLYLDNIQKDLQNLTNSKTDFNYKFQENLDIKTIEKEIEETKNELKKFQEINLASIKEFEIVSERYQNLLMQKEDLEKSIKELENILNNLKDLSKQKILDTLEKVNIKLKEIFPTIFPGGKAQLVLTEKDPLSAGLDLNIKIPGKNIKHLNMLSGGEKALCVIALLICFYLVKPGPFCILDEVDASLDEKNSIQFIKLLQLIKQNSQVILITHNPNIMKEVDTLLGVTMEEKGVSKIFAIKLDQLINEYQPQKSIL